MSVQHWKLQRLSAIFLIPIVISLSYIISLGSIPYTQIIDDLGLLLDLLLQQYSWDLFYFIAQWVWR